MNLLPILTLNNLMEWNNTIFDSVSLPDDINGQLLIDNIIRNYGEMQVIIPDWSAFRYYTNSWFSSHFHQIEKLWDAYNSEYNPIWNKDGTITETRTPDITHTRTPNIKRESSLGSSNTTRDTGNVTEQTQAFNSATFSDFNKTIPNTERTSTNSGKDSITETGTETNRETGTDETVRTEQGNIGVTTTQQMLLEEISLQKKFGFYDIVAKMYAQEFCIMIY